MVSELRFQVSLLRPSGYGGQAGLRAQDLKLDFFSLLKSAIRNPKSEIAATNTSMDQQNTDTDASNGDNGTGAGSYIQATDRSPGFRF